MDEIPGIDGKTIIDMQQAEWLMKEGAARKRLEELGITPTLETFATLTEGVARFNLRGLTALGYLLYPKTAYGVLNGRVGHQLRRREKNSSFNEKLMELCRKPFSEISPMVKGRAKGITRPVYIPDGTPGPSYMELKMRGLLIRELIYRELSGDTTPAGSPLFQMTSVNNDEEVASSLRGLPGESFSEGSDGSPGQRYNGLPQRGSADDRRLYPL